MPVPQNMQLIDSHAHIDFPQFADDREAMLDRARAAGVETILAIGSGPGPEKLDAAIPFAEQHDWIYASIGVHPHEAKLVTPRPPRTTHGARQAPESHRLGRNRTRLFLRSLTPRRARPRFPRPDVAWPIRQSCPSSFIAAMPGPTASESSTKSGAPPASAASSTASPAPSKTPSAASTWASSSPLRAIRPIRKRRTFATLQKLCRSRTF